VTCRRQGAPAGRKNPSPEATFPPRREKIKTPSQKKPFAGGDKYLRHLFIHGARSVLANANRHGNEVGAWVERLKQRRPYNVAVVALANKTARTIWALLAHERRYEKGHLSIKPQAIWGRSCIGGSKHFEEEAENCAGKGDDKDSEKQGSLNLWRLKDFESVAWMRREPMSF